MRQRFHKIIVDQQLIKKGDRVLVGLSGGPDSVALLDLLRIVASEFHLTLFAAHLDHGMRAESGDDLWFVEKLCLQWQVPLTAKKVDVPGFADAEKLGLEEAARKIRHDFFRASAHTLGCDVIALGHNRGDQAETLIHRLIRGVGPAGMAAMRPSDGKVIRPLLEFSRGEIVAYLQKRQIDYLTDQSNFDRRFTRNRIRHEVLPLLTSFNPRLEKQLLQLSHLAAEDESYWLEAMNAVLPSILIDDKDGLILDIPKLLAVHPSLRKRLLRHCLKMLRGSLKGLNFSHVEAVDEMLSSPRAHTEVVIKGCWAGKSYNRLCLKLHRPSELESFSFQVHSHEPLDIPGVGRFQAQLVDRPTGENRWCTEFDAAQVDFPLTVRSFQPGDRFQPSGMTGRKKVKNLYIDAKIERAWRIRVPLVAAPNGHILWVVGMRRAGLFRVQEKGGRVLKLTFDPENDYKKLSL